MADALRLMAERSPGEHVEGWTNRATPGDMWPVWASYREWLAAGDWSPQSARAWIESAHWSASPSERAVLLRVFVRLASDLSEQQAKKAEPKPEGKGNG